MHKANRAVLTAAIIAVLGAGTARADQPTNRDSLLDLSIEQLLDTEVTTASRKAQSARSVPAPLYVITQAAIRRSGATSIPELLRSVPGLQVAQIDANKWAVGARSFNRRFSNKLLVLIDGRPLYTPTFSGVYWDVQDTDLDSIERIEVITGPGATLWGPNAVNGVINIITRESSDSSGRVVAAMLDPKGGRNLTAHAAGAINDAASARVFAKYSELAGNRNSFGLLADASRYQRIGGRVDGHSGDSTWTLIGEAYDGHSGAMATLAELQPPFVRVFPSGDDVSGGFLNAAWTQQSGSGNETAVKLFLDRSVRNGYLVDDSRSSLQLDLQQSIASLNGMVWGASYRRTADHIELPGNTNAVVNPARATVEVAGLYAQHEYEHLPEHWGLIVGAKLENESLTGGTHFEPNVRLKYAPNEKHFWWASVARAVGLPSRGERDAVFTGPVLPPGSASNPLPIPAIVALQSTGKVQAESANTAELGYRWHNDAADLRLDTTIYYSDFDSLTTVQPSVPLCMPFGAPPGLLGCPPGSAYLLVPSSISARGGTKSYGVEIVGEWRIGDHVGLSAHFTMQELDWPFTGSLFNSTAPRHRAGLHAALDLPASMTLDVALRYSDSIGAVGIRAHVGVDARIAYRPSDALEIALSGKDIFDPEHIEFISEAGDLLPVPIERTAQFELRYRF